jgi:hypothetical protein
MQMLASAHLLNIHGKANTEPGLLASQPLSILLMLLSNQYRTDFAYIDAPEKEFAIVSALLLNPS